MNQKTDVEVIIDNKKYIICGYESAEYMEKIASFINRKMAALKSEQWYRNLDLDVKHVLLNINLADDYFKADEKIQELKQSRNETNEDLFAIKHEIINKQNEIDQLRQSYKELEEKYNEAQKTIARLDGKLDLGRQ